MTTVKLKINNDGTIFTWNQPVPENIDSTWRDAVELSPRPKVTTKQIIVPQYNLEVTPIEITYTIINSSVSERIGIEISNLKNIFISDSNTILQNIHSNPLEELNVNLILTKQVDLNEKIAAITAATTHEELDAALGL